MLNVLASRAIKYMYEERLPSFAEARVDTIWSSTGAIAEQVASDRSFDLVIAEAAAIDRFIAERSVVAGSRVDLVRSSIGLAVAAGAPRPDIGSAEDVKRALLAARSVGFSQGPSGRYLLGLFDRMGIAAEIRTKAVVSTPGTPVAHYIASGAAELGFQQVSELVNEGGIDFLGPLPDDIQHLTVFSSGVLTRAASPEAARALQRFLTSPGSGATSLKHGLEPISG